MAKIKIGNGKGPKGDTGQRGPEGARGEQGVRGETGAQGLKGADGKTAYQYAREAGYSGTEAEFAALLNMNGGHISDKNNPHGVTAAQAGADAAGSAAGVQNSLNTHTGNKSNPHGVTAAQVGAVEQSTQSEYILKRASAEEPINIDSDYLYNYIACMGSTGSGNTPDGVGGGVFTVFNLCASNTYCAQIGISSDYAAPLYVRWHSQYGFNPWRAVSVSGHTHTAAEVGAAAINSPVFTGTPKAPTGADYTTYRLRNAMLTTSVPSSIANGDIALVYS